MLKLPTEITIECLSYLTVPNLSPLLATSNHWNAFFSANESSIYRNAAVLHNFIPSSHVSFSRAKSLYPAQSMVGVNDWKVFCKRRFQIDKAWLGRAPSTIKAYHKTGPVTHRFKVDEEFGLVIATSEDGGLLVTDIATDEVVWSLDLDYVRHYAHCEYENGFVCFDRSDGSIEVWRRGCDFEHSALPTESLPDQNQLDEFFVTAVHYAPVPEQQQFRPWALFSMPDTHAFRLVFPTLLVASVNEAYLWDVTTARLCLTIRDTQLSPTFIRPITYVELGERLVFICFYDLLRVFSRIDGTAVYDVGIMDVLSNTFGSQVCLARKNRGADDRVLAEQPLMAHAIDIAQYTETIFLAVHMSGSDVAILLTDSIVAIIRNFEAVIKGQLQRSEASLLISLLPFDILSAPTTYLAFVNGRVAITSHSGVYVIALDGLENMNTLTSDFNQTVLKPNFSNVAISAAFQFECQKILQRPSCLQITDAGLWFTWDHNGPGVRFRGDGPVQRVAAAVCVSLLLDENQTGGN